MPWLALLVCLLLRGEAAVAVDLRRPSSPSRPESQRPFHFAKHRPELFYDNNVVPENGEVNVFVFKDQIRRYACLQLQFVPPWRPLSNVPYVVAVLWRPERYPNTGGIQRQATGAQRILPGGGWRTHSCEALMQRCSSADL